MRYKELIQFDPIIEIVKFSRLTDNLYSERLIKNFVYSKAYEEVIIPVICKNLDYSIFSESFGIQIVGNYGTGKSHLMSLFSIIAEDESYLNFVTNKKAKQHLVKIAGKYKVLRFELGNNQELWDIISYQIDKYLQQLGVNYSISSDITPESYYVKLQKMMAHFEAAYPNKGFMVVIDEMLSYLKGRSEPSKLNTDLAVLQALGQMSDGTKFRMVFGVQEMIYNAAEFQFAADMLQHVNDRYRDLTITKQDVQFIAQNRLLKKDEHQKKAIRDHLKKFVKFFSDMHSHADEYVELFPVHPAYFENFQQIKIGKSQREILKTLSNKFDDIKNQEVPENEPGLICYDAYWQDIAMSADLRANPDVRRVSEVMEIVNQKIDTNFTGARSGKKILAKRIASATAIKILQADLNKLNGVTAETLVDDLCYLDAFCDERELLIDVISTTANNIISATTGQYFDCNSTNLEYHLRIEGGVNYEQKIKDYASQMSAEQKDEYFFKFLTEILPIETDPYRSGFKIWAHKIEWLSHKTTRDGYIFMGNPANKSTTHPKQHFYIYFMPIFNEKAKQRNADPDELYFILDGLSNTIKNHLALYGAATAQELSADTAQKNAYKKFTQRYFGELRDLFNKEFIEKTQVEYQGRLQALSTFNIPGGLGKDQIVSKIASIVFEDQFNEENGDYPKFNLLQQPITSDNFDRFIKSAKQKIVAPQNANRDGEAILAGLGLWSEGKLSTDTSIYARSLKQMLEDKGELVINRTEILDEFWREDNLFISHDFKIEADFEFLVLSVMAALGEVEIFLAGGKIINAANINDIVALDKYEYYSFSHIRRPQGINVAAIKEIFVSLVGQDLSNSLSDPETFVKLLNKVNSFSTRAAKMEYNVKGGYTYHGDIQVISETDGLHYSIELAGFKGMCDKLRNYNTEAKIKNLPWSVEEIRSTIKAIETLEKLEKNFNRLHEFDKELNFLRQAKQYIIDTSFIDDIDNVFAELTNVIKTNDEVTSKDYISELQVLHSRYATWYVDEYVKYHINELTDADKQKLANSEHNVVCGLVRDADFINSARYDLWQKQMTSLVVADSRVTREAVMATPYHNFNPKEYQGKLLPELKDLKQELEDIYIDYDVAFHDALEDPGVKKNIDALDATEQTMLKQFADKVISLDRTYAPQLKQIISRLHKGFTKIEISQNKMLQIFSRPMTPEDALAAFRSYIDKETIGKDRNNIRIIVK